MSTLWLQTRRAGHAMRALMWTCIHRRKKAITWTYSRSMGQEGVGCLEVPGSSKAHPGPNTKQISLYGTWCMTCAGSKLVIYLCVTVCHATYVVSLTGGNLDFCLKVLGDLRSSRPQEKEEDHGAKETLDHQRILARLQLQSIYTLV